MTMSAAQILALTPGKHNMASEAFLELKLARAEGRAPKGQELSFGDLVDTLNPLQHLPLIGSAYRALTGDTMSAPAKVTGAAIYGGPAGAVASVMGEAIDPTKPAQTPDKPEPALAFAAPSQAAAQNAEENAAQIAAPDAAAHVAAKTAANDTLTTASVVKSAASPAPAGPPLPKLSSEAFDALIRSFPQGGLSAPAADKAATATPVPSMPTASLTAKEEASTPLTLTPPALLAQQANPPAPAELAAMMQASLDKYEAMKALSGEKKNRGF